MAVTTTLGVTDIEDYTITAAVSTLDPTDLSGSTGGIDLKAPPVNDAQFLRNKSFTITDSAMGSIAGRVSNVEYSDTDLSVTAETTLQRLNTDVTVAPKYLASTAACMDAALTKAGFVSSGLSSSGTDTFPGWNGKLWDYLKHFCAARNKEYYSLASDPNTLVFRDIRTQTLSGQKSAESYAVNDQSLALGVDVVRYTYAVPASLSSNVEFAPAHTKNEPQILTVEAGQTVEYDIELNGWVSELNQPAVLDYVAPGDRTDTGAYCVAGNDGLPVTAAQWTAQGGNLVVSTTDNPAVIHVVLTGPGVTELPTTSGGTTLSPFSIAATAVDDNTFYNSLHITGKGVMFETETTRFSTGIVSSVTVEEVGATVDNPFISSQSTQFDIGVAAAQRFAGSHTFSLDLVPATNAIEATVGARFTGTNGAVFRVEGVTSTFSGISATGSSDTMLSENDTTWAGKTLADRDANWAGKTLNEQMASPLWKAS